MARSSVCAGQAQRAPEKAQRRMNGQRNLDPRRGWRIGRGCACDLAPPDEKEGTSLELRHTSSVGRSTPGACWLVAFLRASNNAMLREACWRQRTGVQFSAMTRFLKRARWRNISDNRPMFP